MNLGEPAENQSPERLDRWHLILAAKTFSLDSCGHCESCDWSVLSKNLMKWQRNNRFELFILCIGMQDLHCNLHVMIKLH